MGLGRRAMVDRPPALNPLMFQFHTCSGDSAPRKEEKTARSKLLQDVMKPQNLKVRALEILVNAELEGKWKLIKQGLYYITSSHITLGVGIARRP